MVSKKQNTKTLKEKNTEITIDKYNHVSIKTKSKCTNC